LSQSSKSSSAPLSEVSDGTSEAETLPFERFSKTVTAAAVSRKVRILSDSQFLSVVLMSGHSKRFRSLSNRVATTQGKLMEKEQKVKKSKGKILLL